MRLKNKLIDERADKRTDKRILVNTWMKNYPQFVKAFQKFSDTVSNQDTYLFYNCTYKTFFTV